jgi:hypothetical protein
MGKIKIKNRVRIGYDIRIYLDDHIMCVLPSGGEFDFDIPTGEHKLRAKERVYGSKDFSFTIFNKDERVFTVSKSNTDNFFLLSMYILLAIMGGIFFSYSFSKDNFPGTFAITGLIIFVFYIFVFRNNSFVIREESINNQR